MPVPTMNRIYKTRNVTEKMRKVAEIVLSCQELMVTRSVINEMNLYN